MSDLTVLEKRIEGLTTGLSQMPENETIQVSRTFIANVRKYMVELLELRRAEPNEPLTFDELRKTPWRDPVWVSVFDDDGRLCSTWCHLRGRGNNLFVDNYNPPRDAYAKTWTAYRNKPTN